MNITNISEDIYQLTMNVENMLFEGIWEIPKGVSLNSYIVKGEKTAIIDGVCGWDNAPEEMLKLLADMEIVPECVEYLIVNHTEPDHSGWLEAFEKINPNCKIICSKKAKDLLNAFYGDKGNIVCVGDGDSLDLGRGHVLKFAEIPNVHWPDTMATFDVLTGTLFSCDAFGSFGSITGTHYADELSESELKEYETETIRYYSNIVASFSTPVKRAISKCESLPIKMIAPGHGLIWRNPAKIMKEYLDYATYQQGPARCEITLIWGSMYGMTQKAVDYIIQLLEKEGIKFHVHQVPEDSWGTILTSTWTSTGIILAMPTYEFKMFPPMASVLEELAKKRVINRKAFRLGSYGWSGGAQKELDEITTRLNMNWNFIEPVEFNGIPREKDFELIEQRVQELVRLVKETE